MDAKAEVIETLTKVGFEPTHPADPDCTTYSRAVPGSSRTVIARVDPVFVDVSIRYKDLPAFLASTPSLSDEEKQRLEEICGLLGGGGYARDLVGLRDLHYLLSLVDRLVGGA